MIDGGLQPTSNCYRAIIYHPGILYDIRTGKSAPLPKEKMKMIENQYYGKKENIMKTQSYLPLMKPTKGNQTVFSQKRKFNLPSVNRLRYFKK